MNHTLIFLNTAPTPQNIIRMIVEKHILIIGNVSEKSSSNSPSVQVLHQPIRGVKACADNAETEGEGTC